MFQFDESKARKWRKKPVVVDAYQTQEEVIIPTLEGDHKANSGDWIIRGTVGELYPCKEAIFPTIYEPVEVNGKPVRCDISTGINQRYPGNRQPIIGGKTQEQWLEHMNAMFPNREGLAYVLLFDAALYYEGCTCETCGAPLVMVWDRKLMADGKPHDLPHLCARDHNHPTGKAH